MSAIATITIVSADKLATFLASRGRWDELVAGADHLDYHGSGYVLATLLPYLGGEGIALRSSHDSAVAAARDGACAVFTHDHRRFLDRLDPDRFEGSRLRAYYEELNATDADGVEGPMLDGIRFFRDAIGQLREDTVAVLVIG